MGDKRAQVARMQNCKTLIERPSSHQAEVLADTGSIASLQPAAGLPEVTKRDPVSKSKIPT
jgi:hypothetical protein